MDLELPVLKTGTPTCEGCIAHCCRYILIEIDKPEAKWQYDQIRWMLLHQSVTVGVDNDGDWFVEVPTKCTQLGPDNKCMSYLKRPHLCETYSTEECQVWNPQAPYKLEFRKHEEFIAWLDKRGVDWRYTADEQRAQPNKIRMKKARKRA